MSLSAFPLLCVPFRWMRVPSHHAIVGDYQSCCSLFAQVLSAAGAGSKFSSCLTWSTGLDKLRSYG
jgi:hypothetical protein